MMVRPPILLDIRKDKIKATVAGTAKSYEGELYVWTEENEKKGKKVITSVGNQNGSSRGERHKVFYHLEQMVIDDFKLALIGLKWLLKDLQTDNLSALIKPILIINIPYSITDVELSALQECANLAGAREIYILNEEMMPSEYLFKPNHKLPGKVIYGDDRFRSDEAMLLFFALGAIGFTWLLISNLL